jgi:hypothetical protein
MVSRAKDTHTTNRVVRVPDADWEELGQLVGERNRAHLIREFIAWYLRRPQAVLRRRPDAETLRDMRAARTIAES